MIYRRLSFSYDPTRRVYAKIRKKVQFREAAKFASKAKTKNQCFWEIFRTGRPRRGTRQCGVKKKLQKTLILAFEANIQNGFFPRFSSLCTNF